MEQKTKNYEIAYLLSPSISEEEVLTHAEKLNALIEEQKGTVKHFQEPRKHKLSYPIQKERNAYFGWSTFRLAPDAVTQLKKKLNEYPHVLRYLIVEEETRLRAPVFRTPTRPMSQKSPTIPREAEKGDEKLDLEALDKKLEEILGK